jgi:hypothetical protein
MAAYIQYSGPGNLESYSNTSQYEACWDDLRFPATVVKPPGQASDPDFDTTNGTLLFAATGTEVIYVIAQMPHSWKEGSAVSPHIHWYKTTSASGNVVWQLEYKKFPIGEVGDSEFTVLTASTPAVSDGDTAFRHALTPFDDIDMTGMTLSDMLLMKISRLGGDAADTYAADAAMMEFDIHYQSDTLGSEYEFVK